VLPTGSHTRRQLERAQPDFLLERFSQLPSVLPRIWMPHPERRGAALFQEGVAR
jgi:hypothetical protein